MAYRTWRKVIDDKRGDRSYMLHDGEKNLFAEFVQEYRLQGSRKSEAEGRAEYKVDPSHDSPKARSTIRSSRTHKSSTSVPANATVASDSARSARPSKILRPEPESSCIGKPCRSCGRTRSLVISYQRPILLLVDICID